MGVVSLKPAFAGVDTHKDTNMLGLKDGLGRTIGTWEFPANLAGYRALARAIGDISVPVGVEGTRSYGAGLAAFLQDFGFEVYEVIRPRKEQRWHGKCDEMDALAACDNIAANKCTPIKNLSRNAEELRWTMIAREQLVSCMGQLACRVDSMLVTAPTEMRERWGDESGAARMKAIAASRPKDACGQVLRMLACEYLTASAKSDELESQIRELVAGMYPNLLGAPGVGAISAARIALSVGSNPERMKSEAAFSMLCGTSPIPASSGKTHGRHRLNRGGDRQANRAVHEIARARMAHDERTQDYIDKKMSEGKSKREAIRCLCRYIARELYGLLIGSQETACDQRALVKRRKAARFSQIQVAEGAGITKSKVSRLERMVEFDTASLAKYDKFLRDAESSKIVLDNI